MSYSLRDLPDGRVEMVLSQPVLIAIFPERRVAQRICTALDRDQAAAPASEASRQLEAPAKDEAMSSPKTLQQFRDLIESSRVQDAPTTMFRSVRNLTDATQDAGGDAQILTLHPRDLPDAQRERAFRRLACGEALSSVARDLRLRRDVLRVAWEAHKRSEQRLLAAQGQRECEACRRAFTPSLTRPSLCARCSQ